MRLVLDGKRTFSVVVLFLLGGMGGGFRALSHAKPILPTPPKINTY